MTFEHGTIVITTDGQNYDINVKQPYQYTPPKESVTDRISGNASYVLLRNVDSKWMQHIDAMDDLKQGIELRAYGKRNPLIEYKFESRHMFENMNKSLQEDVVRLLFRVQVVSSMEHKPITTTSEQKKFGRNMPCPCGSGKKYKKCCGESLHEPERDLLKLPWWKKFFGKK